MTKEHRVTVRELEVDHIPAVYHLGNRLFRGPHFTTLYRTWDAYEVTTAFNQDPELSLVAEDEGGEIVGFALGTTYEKERGSWTYGHMVWLGIAPEHQGQGLGQRLYHEIERRLQEEGVRMVMVDTASSNAPAIRFFQRLGFAQPRHQVWLSKMLRRDSHSQTG